MTGPINSLAYNSPVAFFIAQTPPDDLPDNVKGAFNDVYNAIQQLIQALVNNCGIGPQPLTAWPQLSGGTQNLLSGNLRRLYVPATEDIQFGAIVTLFNNAGVLSVRNANATDNTRLADGFCTTQGGIASGSVGEIMLSTGVVSIGSLTKGTRYFLSTTDGLVQPGPAVGAGNVEQYIGLAIDENDLYVNIGIWIQH